MQIFKQLLGKVASHVDSGQLCVAEDTGCGSSEIAGVGESVLKSFPSSFDSGLLNGAPVAILAKNIRTFSDFIGWSRAQGSDVVVLDHKNLKPFLAFRKDLALVMVDLDDSELEDALEELADIRESHPELAVILASQFFGRDDFSLSRLSVGDVSLKLPISMRKLDLAVVLALENNLEWQSRQARMDVVSHDDRKHMF